ncbi:MAG TPA: hypothetical protein VF092_17530 [Longimicrobium sp.]
MSDERPAAERPDPIRETPAPERAEISAFGAGRPASRGGGERPARREPPSLTWQGVRAALAMFVASGFVSVGTLVWAQLSDASSDQALSAFVTVGGAMAVVAVLAAPAVSLWLPRGARGPFWAMGIIMAFLGFILWGGTCGLATIAAGG